MILMLADGSPTEAEVIARWSIGEYLLAMEVHLEKIQRQKGYSTHTEE